MNPSTQMFITWTLLGVLLAWMFFFAFLALRVRKTEQRDTADLPTPSGVFSVSMPRTALHRSSSPVEVSLGGMPAIVQEARNDVGVAPVA